MKTSKTEVNKQDSNYPNWDKFKTWIDRRPSRTALVMAVILLVSFIYFCYTTIQRINNPPEKKIMQEIMQRYDSVNIDISSAKQGVLDDLERYMILQQVKKEVEEMRNDSSKRDTARINELMRILKLTEK